jgi:hypothetical protein
LQNPKFHFGLNNTIPSFSRNLLKSLVIQEC